MPFKFNELAAAFKERGFVLAQLMNPFGERGERIGSREQGIKPLECAIVSADRKDCNSKKDV